MEDTMFVMPSFLSGASRVFDIGGTMSDGLYVVSGSAAEADSKGIARDWRAVGRDLADTLEKRGKEEPRQAR